MAAPIYADLNISFESNEMVQRLVDFSSALGFERFAINNVVQSLQSKKTKKQAAKPQILPPTSVLLNQSSVDDLKAKSLNFHQLSRFTLTLDDAANTHRLGSPEVKAYDIIAVQPTDEKTFQLACSTLDVDIISLNFSENLGFTLKRPLVKLAIKRGIHFEIVYSPALKDSGVKRNIISNAMSLIRISRGKGVIISSGAQQPIDIRSPWDVINLGKLFGLNQAQAKDALCRNPRAVIKHAEARKTCKTVISVTDVSSLKPDEKWILQPSRTETMSHQKTASEKHMESSDEESSDGIGSKDESESSGSDSETQEKDAHSKPKKLKLDTS